MNVPDLLDEAKARRNLPPCEERRRIRERCGLSVHRVAAHLGVSDSTVANWEAGAQSPRPEHVTAYAALLEELSADD